MPRQIQGSQTDFSGGEIDVDSKRADGDPTRKAACRQMSNFRILSSKTVQNRSGRSAKFPETARVDEVLMSPGNLFYIAFGNGYLKVYNSAGAQVFTTTKLGDGTTNIPWTTATLKNIVWDIAQTSIYITYGDIAPLNVPQILAWDGATTWTLATFATAFINAGFGSGGQSRTLFYRISPHGITLQPAAVSGGAVAVLASAPYFVAGMVGTRIRFNGRQMKVTVVTDSTHATVSMEENILPSLALNFGSDVTSIFNVGDVIIGATTGSKGIIASFSSVTQINVTYTNNVGFTTEKVVGPSGAATITSVSAEPPNALTLWDEEVMNNYRGWPTSVFFDQGRLGFCNFPSVPNGIAWASIGDPTDFYPDPPSGITPANAIFEIAPRKSRVFYVIAGPESSEFVFCDNGIYYIPINVTNPLKPGSVAFNLISTDGAAANVQPRVLQEAILWVNNGQTSVMSITATGAYYRPYEVRNLTTLHSHLVKTPIAIAVPSTVSQFDERYAYFLNTDGTITCGAYSIENGQIKGIIGWVPFNGAGTVKWMSSRLDSLLMTTTYAPNGITPVGVVEQLDETQYLDSAFPVNAVPTPFVTGGKGPLFYIANGSVTLMDKVTRNMGTYQIDANGFIVPQFNGGEDLTLASLVAGQPWTAILEPFAPEAQSGADVHQRTKTRQMSMFAPWVINSTGFLMAMLFSQKQSQTTPALGTIMNQRRVPDHNTGEDATLAPILRETVEIYSPTGSSFDPRVAIIKDTPGPLLIAEIAMEVTI